MPASVATPVAVEVNGLEERIEVLAGAPSLQDPVLTAGQVALGDSGPLGKAHIALTVLARQH